MSATPNSAEVWIVVDPVQDYEESLKILGVYGSKRAAQAAHPRLVRQLGIFRNGIPPVHYLEVQHWRGDELVSTEKLREVGDRG